MRGGGLLGPEPFEVRCLCLFEGRSLVLLEQLVDPVEGARRDTRELLRAVADYGEGLATSGLAVREDADVVAVDGRLDQVLWTTGESSMY